MQRLVIEEAACNFDKRLEKAFIKTKKDPNRPIFSNALARLTRKYSPNEITEIINYALYERYYGTFGNTILKIVFQPSIINPVRRIKWFVSPAQAHDALHNMFILITKYGLDYQLRDYYCHTMAQSIFLIIDESAPEYIVSIGYSFVYLLKHGPNIVLKQQVYVKEWLQRRRAAVRTLESWWFEVINSPYTRVGKRNIEKLALAWHANAAALVA